MANPDPVMEINSADFVIGVASPAQLPTSTQPEVAFVGRSNVGKSSLINLVLGRRRLARTSGSPGKTREFNFYLVNEAFHLVDLPGLGYARVSRADRTRWARHIRSYLQSRQTLCLVFHLIDSRHSLMGADDELLDLYRNGDVPVVVVLTKADKLSGNERKKAQQRVKTDLLARGLELPLVLASSLRKEGRDEILDWIGVSIAGAP